jgi:hypothetical protein
MINGPVVYSRCHDGSRHDGGSVSGIGVIETWRSWCLLMAVKDFPWAYGHHDGGVDAKWCVAHANREQRGIVGAFLTYVNSDGAMRIVYSNRFVVKIRCRLRRSNGRDTVGRL